MMNRIILIGNGFDLVHGLPKSYADFIDYYWKQWGKRLQQSYLGNELTDNLCSISQKGEPSPWYWLFPTADVQKGMIIPPQNAIEDVKSQPDKFIIDKKPFFQHIDNAIETKKWVDIENEYYQFLKRIVKKDTKLYENPRGLDAELDTIKSKLVAYLSKIQKYRIVPELKNEDIRKAIYAPFKAKDISVNGRSAFDEFLTERWRKAHDAESIECKSLLHRFGYNWQFDTYDIQKHVESYDVPKHIERIYNGAAGIHDYFLLPSEVLFLNFNYTKTADLYISKSSDFKINHIHGELDSDKNSVIFGYGDELDEDYKTISNLNDNSYLTNIKSIRYLETDNYRQLLRFIGSAPYQIYIMGHSCGNSGRTLLNTLFEHKNCVSIKPYYYEWTDEEGGHNDNYIEIIQNISRNFNSMQLMRDRVINKSYCQPLPQKPKVAAIE